LRPASRLLALLAKYDDQAAVGLLARDVDRYRSQVLIAAGEITRAAFACDEIEAPSASSAYRRVAAEWTEPGFL
jgi:hypothetical protein